MELTVYRPDGTVYGVYNVTESIDISIPKAEAGDWKFKTVNKCTTSVTYEIETKGSGTGMFVGRVNQCLYGPWDRGGHSNLQHRRLDRYPGRWLFFRCCGCRHRCCCHIHSNRISYQGSCEYSDYGRCFHRGDHSDDFRCLGCPAGAIVAAVACNQ